MDTLSKLSLQLQSNDLIGIKLLVALDAKNLSQKLFTTTDYG